MTPGHPLLLAGIALLGCLFWGRASRRLNLIFTLVASVTTLGACLWVLCGTGDWDWHSHLLLGGERIHLRLDGISALFLALLAVLGGAGAVYASEYWSDEEHPRSAARARLWWSALILNMGLVLLCSNGLHFLIAWELFTISAYFLITLDNQRREVRAAGWLYLAASHFGTLFLFAFFGILASRNGNWDLGPMREQAALAPLFWLGLMGFGVKAGLFPLHVWLPAAHANAPSHVSAILSGMAIKLGIYGLVRFTGWLPTPASAGWVLIAIGSWSALLGVAFALTQNDLKRMLAYCSIENVGIILVALGCAVLGLQQGDAPWGRLALIAGLLHVLNHGLFKGLLFFGAGAVVHATGTREMNRLGGLWKTMPWTAGLFALGAVAISGLPPLNGFVSEWMLYLSLFDGVLGHGAAAWATMPAIIILAMTGALALACFVKASAVVFLGAPRTQAAVHAHECGPRMRAPMLVLAGLCAVIGLAPFVVWPLVSRASLSWHPGKLSMSVPAPVFAMGSFNVSLFLLAVLAVGLLLRRVRLNGLSRSMTWDCGYAVPSARMQYSAGSLSATAGSWFAWILQPQRVLKRVRGLFPPEARCVDRSPETMLEKVLIPTSVVILRVSTAVRSLQHGRLQTYIFYLLAGLGALGALVLMEGLR